MRVHSPDTVMFAEGQTVPAGKESHSEMQVLEAEHVAGTSIEGGEGREVLTKAMVASNLAGALGTGTGAVLAGLDLEASAGAVMAYMDLAAWVFA